MGQFGGVKSRFDFCAQQCYIPSGSESKPRGRISVSVCSENQGARPFFPTPPFTPLKEFIITIKSGTREDPVMAKINAENWAVAFVTAIQFTANPLVGQDISEIGVKEVL